MAALMRFLIVSPGQTHSTADIFEGLRAALYDAGNGVGTYALTERIQHSQECLMLRYTRAKENLPALSEPDFEDVLYHACQDLLAAALRYDVDWVLFVSSGLVPPEIYVLLRKAGLRVVILFTESPYEDDRQSQIAPLANACFTNERTSIDFLRRFNPHTYYLRHAYDPTVHFSTNSDRSTTYITGTAEGAPAHDVLFVGTLWQERIELLEAVDWTGIDLAIYGEQKWLPESHSLWRHVRGEHVDNAFAAAMYRRAKVCLNLYRESSFYAPNAPRVRGAQSVNPRAMELAACGAFQIAQPRAEAKELFGASVPVFRTSEELETLIRQSLHDPIWRASAADLARQKVEGQTFAARAAELVAILAPLQSRKGDTPHGSPTPRQERRYLDGADPGRRADEVGVAG